MLSLPPNVQKEILSYLPKKERFGARLVCKAFRDTMPLSEIMPYWWQKSPLGGHPTTKKGWEQKFEMLSRLPENRVRWALPSLIFHAVTCMAVSKNSRYFAIGTQGGSVELREAQTGLLKQSWQTPHEIKSLAITMVGNVIAGTTSGHIVSCERQNAAIKTCRFKASPILNCVISPDDATVLIAHPSSIFFHQTSNLTDATRVHKAFHFPPEPAHPFIAEFADPNFTLIGGGLNLSCNTIQPFRTTHTFTSDDGHWTSATFAKKDDGTADKRLILGCHSNRNFYLIQLTDDDSIIRTFWSGAPIHSVTCFNYKFVLHSQTFNVYLEATWTPEEESKMSLLKPRPGKCNAFLPSGRRIEISHYGEVFLLTKATGKQIQKRSFSSLLHPSFDQCLATEDGHRLLVLYGDRLELKARGTS